MKYVTLASVLLAACGQNATESGTTSTDSIPAGAVSNSEPAEAAGQFHWVAWADVPADVKAELRTYSAGAEGVTIGVETQADADGGCDIQVARHDFDGDGKPGIVITRQCMDYCGTAGCAFEVYENGGRSRIQLVDQVEDVLPAKNGVTTSAGLFIALAPFTN